LNIWRIDTEILPSKIHGQGRFTMQTVLKGDLVLIINGEIKPRDKAPRKFPITEELNMDCDDTFVNHSKQNNLDLDGQIFFIANRDIAAGEELTMDYEQFAKGQYLF
jgi:SET domain-containing protein